MTKLLTAWTVSALLFVLAWPALSQAAEKSFAFRGKRVTLTEATDVLLVKGPGTKSAKDVAAAALEAQARVLKKDIGPAALRLVRNPAKYSPALGGVLVPRLGEVKEPQLAAIAASSEAIESVHTVYRSGKQEVIARDTLSVRFKGGLNPRFLFALSSEFDLKESRRPKYAESVVQFEVPKGQDPFELCDQLAAKGFIQWAQPDLSIKLQFNQVDESKISVPNDQHFGSMWHMQKGEGGPQVPEAWTISTGTADITVAVIDTGVDLNHPDLKANLVGGFDFIDFDTRAQPDTDPFVSPHGTTCSGVVAATGNNGEGVCGVAPLAKIMPIKIADRIGFANDTELGESIQFAADNGAKVISCSWGGGPPSNAIADAIDSAVEAGSLVVFAAGNSGPAGDVAFPGKYDKVICVGATTENRVLAGFSSWRPGGEVDISAPGADIFTTDMVGADGYDSGQADNSPEDSGNYMPDINGTSFACPFVAGVAALVWSSFPDLTADQMRTILLETADEIDPDGGEYQDGYSNKYGSGQVNAMKAMQRAKQLTGKSALGQPMSAFTGSRLVLNSGEGRHRTDVRPPAERQDTRRVLQELLRMRRQLGEDGLPKSVGGTKAIGDLAEIKRRERQLAELAEPQPQTYSFRGKSIVLTPSDDWFVMRLPGDSDKQGDLFWQVVHPDTPEEVTKQIQIVGAADHGLIVLTPRRALRDAKQLADLAKTGNLPPLSPVYSSDGSLLVPTGVVTLRLEENNQAAKGRLLAFAEQKGLVLASSDQDTLRFLLGSQSNYSTVFPAVRALAAQPGVRWCEPDLARQIVRLDN